VSDAGGNGFGTRTFWTAAIPDSDVQINPGAGTAELHVTNLPILDYPKIPVALGPHWQTAFVPATISFDFVWSGPVTRRVNVQNGTNGDQFAGEFEQNQVTVTWSGSNANGFSFTGNAGDLSTTTIPGFAFAEVGHLSDGIFASSDGGDSGVPSGAFAGPTFASGGPVGAFAGSLPSPLARDTFLGSQSSAAPSSTTHAPVQDSANILTRVGGMSSLDPTSVYRHLADFTSSHLSLTLARTTMRSSGLPHDAWRDPFGSDFSTSNDDISS
jgi:hypothetical protein